MTTPNPATAVLRRLERRLAVRAFAWSLIIALAWPAIAQCQTISPTQRKAPGFTDLPRDAKIIVAPIDVELFELSVGGVLQPKADWTEAASRHMKAAVGRALSDLKIGATHLTDSLADEQHEALSLNGAISSAIALHHAGAGIFALPTKAGKLDWSFGSALNELRKATAADYALFIWMRDSYASAERKVAMVAFALVGVGLTGGTQVGYATLVDLKSGRVEWFNRLLSASGDLREAEPAMTAVGTLLSEFPTPGN